MFKKSRVIVAFLAVFTIFLTYKQLIIAKEWDFQPIDDVNKVWEVRFNIPLESSSLTADSVYVLNGKNKHATTLRLVGNGNTINVFPTIPYEVGKQYRLMITGAVKSSDGKPLKTPVEVPFEVVNTTDDIQSIYSQSIGTLTNITVITSPDVHRVTVSGENMDYKGNNRFKATLIDVKPGSTISIISYDDNNKRLQTKRHKIEDGY